MRISVVIPVYNAREYVKDAIESVLAQDCQPEEIIVVNDGSTDGDYEKLRSEYPRVRVVNQQNKGVSAARNLGCHVASFEYVAILDADDIWLPGKLRAQVSALHADPKCAAVYCNGLIWRPPPGPGRAIPPRLPARKPGFFPESIRLRYADFLLGIPVAPSTMLIKKAAWEAIGGFDERRRYAEDQDFNVRLSRQFNVAVLRMAGVLYRKHDQSATAAIRDGNHWADLISECVSKYGGGVGGNSIDLPHTNRHLATLHFLHGYNHYWSGSVKVAQREFREALRLRLRSPKCVVYWLLGFAFWLRPILKKLRAGLLSRPPVGNVDRPNELAALGDIGTDQEWLLAAERCGTR